jgi:hypothetical protein
MKTQEELEKKLAESNGFEKSSLPPATRKRKKSTLVEE